LSPNGALAFCQSISQSFVGLVSFGPPNREGFGVTSRALHQTATGIDHSRGWKITGSGVALSALVGQRWALGILAV
jgi:hypothetical protein